LTAISFERDELRYRRWLDAHPTGFVLNCEQSPRPSYLILHHAECGTINGTPARGKFWTKDCIKVCAASRREIETWIARCTDGGTAQECQLCFR
jgi:hypothetical protein